MMLPEIQNHQTGILDGLEKQSYQSTQNQFDVTKSTFLASQILLVK